MNLIDIESLNIKEIKDIVSLASQFRSDTGGFNQEPIYGDKKVGILFFEPSTRTKSSFEIALLNLGAQYIDCLLYTSPSPRDRTRSRMPSSA